MRSELRLMIVVAALGIYAPALAADQKDYKDCDAVGDVDRVITGCDRVLADRRESREKRAKAYNNRELAWDDKGDLDRASADHNEAIRLDPKFAN